MNNSIIIPPPISYNSSSIINNEITQKLEKFGYKVIEYIRLKDQKSFKYVKTINPRGHTVLIELDESINVNSPNLITVESVPVGDQIPFSLKSGMLSAAGNNVLGISFECKNGYCLLRHNDNFEVTENFLNIVEKPSDKVAFSTDSLLAIPIIKLSDIIENPTMVLQITTIASINIVNASIAAFKNHLKSTDTELKQLMNNADKVMGLMYVTMDTVANSLDKYERGRTFFDEHPPLNQSTISEYQRVIYNIKKHRELIENILRIGLSLGDIRNSLNEVNSLFNNINEDINSIK